MVPYPQRLTACSACKCRPVLVFLMSDLSVTQLASKSNAPALLSYNLCFESEQARRKMSISHLCVVSNGQMGVRVVYENRVSCYAIRSFYEL
jgi:hypothetical protein